MKNETADVAELVYALDLKSNGTNSHKGSTPFVRTNLESNLMIIDVKHDEVLLKLKIETLINFMEKMKYEYHLPEYEKFLDEVEQSLKEYEQKNSHSQES